MEWYSKFNYSNTGNGSDYMDRRFGAWPHIGAGYDFEANMMSFGFRCPDVMSGIFREIFKSSLLTLVSLFGIARLKSTCVKTAVQHVLETACVVLMALMFYALLLTFLAPFAIYRLFVYAYYRMFRPTCVLMHGTDAFWCMDSNEARSIINILIFLEINDSGENLLEALMEQMIKLCSDPTYGLKFMSYRRKSTFGYYYWEKGHLSNLKNHFNYIEESIRNENDLNTFLSAIVNKNIDGFGWEVYVSQNNIENSNLRPVIFRMHHSIGDGSSILQALMNAISDKTKSKITLSETINISFQPKGTNFKMTSPKSESLIIQKNKLMQSLKLNINKIPSFIYGPLNLIRQMFDEIRISKLSVSKLSGNKIVTCYSDEEILKNLKTIRRKTNSKFSEVVFSLFSISIWKYFERQKTQVPDYINVVVPIFGDRRNLKVTSEILKEGSNIKVSKISEVNKGMSNDFWVALLKLPVKTNDSVKSLKNTVHFVKESTEKLSRSPDFIMYKFILSVIVTLVPGHIVKPMFDIAKTHLVFSNLPGPQDEIRIAGNKVTQMTFWLPNRGTTGLGLSLLSNNNRLSIGLIADTAVIPTNEDLQSIMNDFIELAKKECL